VDEVEGSLDEALKGNTPEGSAVYYGTALNRQDGTAGEKRPIS
jgi:hypothetical protein